MAEEFEAVFGGVAPPREARGAFYFGGGILK
jgi:hypothetical protein